MMMTATKTPRDGSSRGLKGQVLVTGANGYIASHIVYQLLASNYQVRATVRDPANAKAAFLREMPSALRRLEVVQCNLLSNQGWDEAVSGCDYVIHAAAPFDMHMPESQLIETGIAGSRNVLNACVKHRKNIKKIVFTSSVASVMVGHSKKECKRTLFTEEHFSIEAESHGYELSKLLAEVEAHNIINAANDNGRDDPKILMDVICPGLVVGPILADHHKDCQSSKYIRQLLRNTLLLGADLCSPLTDVRDVAKLHISAMEDSRSGNRYISASDGHCNSSLKNIAFLMHGALSGKCGWKPPKKFMWKPVCKAMALVHPDIKRAKYWIGNPAKCSNQRAKDELGMTFRPIESAVKEHVISLFKYANLDAKGYDQNEIDQYAPY